MCAGEGKGKYIGGGLDGRVAEIDGGEGALGDAGGGEERCAEQS